MSVLMYMERCTSARCCCPLDHHQQFPPSLFPRPSPVLFPPLQTENGVGKPALSRPTLIFIFVFIITSSSHSPLLPSSALLPLPHPHTPLTATPYSLAHPHSSAADISLLLIASTFPKPSRHPDSFPLSLMIAAMTHRADEPGSQNAASLIADS